MSEASKDGYLTQEEIAQRELADTSFILLDALEKEKSIDGRREATELLPDRRIAYIRHMGEPSSWPHFLMIIRQSGLGKSAWHSDHYLWDPQNPELQIKQSFRPETTEVEQFDRFSEQDLSLVKNVLLQVRGQRLARQLNLGNPLNG